jgi:hypothetical protein
MGDLAEQVAKVADCHTSGHVQIPRGSWQSRICGLEVDMRNSILRGALVGILLLGFAIPGVALAGGGGKGCSNIGTWFGVASSDPTEVAPPPWTETILTGWSATVTGKSSNEGTNNFEYPTFDASFSEIPELAGKEPFVDAERVGSLRGTWKRTGGNTFDYTFMGFAFGEANTPVYIAKISGQVTLFNNCQNQYTTAVMEVFLPFMNPFHDEPIVAIPLGVSYGYRAKVDLPPMPF